MTEKVTATQALLYALTIHDGPMPTAAIVEATNLTHRAVAVVAAQLVRKEHITWDEATGAQITEKGRAAYKSMTRKKKHGPKKQRTTSRRALPLPVTSKKFTAHTPEEVEDAEALVKQLQQMGFDAHLTKTEREIITVVTDIEIEIGPSK